MYGREPFGNGSGLAYEIKIEAKQYLDDTKKIFEKGECNVEETLCFLDDLGSYTLVDLEQEEKLQEGNQDI